MPDLINDDTKKNGDRININTGAGNGVSDILKLGIITNISKFTPFIVGLIIGSLITGFTVWRLMDNRQERINAEVQSVAEANEPINDIFKQSKSISDADLEAYLSEINYNKRLGLFDKFFGKPVVANKECQTFDYSAQDNARIKQLYENGVRANDK